MTVHVQRERWTDTPRAVLVERLRDLRDWLEWSAVADAAIERVGAEVIPSSSRRVRRLPSG